MAEWVLLLFVLIVIALTFFASMYLYGTYQELLPWIVAAVLLAIGVGTYIVHKSNTVGGKLKEVYNVDDLS